MENKFYDIPGWEGIYKINMLGQVKSVERNVNSNGGGKLFVGGIFLTPTPDKRNYLKVKLTKNNKPTSYLLHRLIALTFIPNPNNFQIVRHLNDVHNDNRIENLCWGTNKHNTEDAIKNGKFTSIKKFGKDNWSYGKKGINSPVFGRKHIPLNKKILMNVINGVFYESIKEAADSLNVSSSHLSNMLSGRKINNTNLIIV